MSKKKDTSLVLRTCGPDGTSTNGFKWPLTVGSEAVCPDWEKTNECGNGLHGWLYGEGDHSVGNTDPGRKWLVVEVVSDTIIMLGGKCKFPRGVVRFVGDMADAAAFIPENEPRAANVAIIGASIRVGDGLRASVGALGTATSGDSGTSTSGDSGTSTSGDSGTSTSGDRGTSTSGDRGTSTSGYSGTSTSGDSGTSTSGDSGTSKAGKLGEIRIRWWDDKNDRYRTVVGYVGEDGIEPDTFYRLDDNHKFIKA